MNNIVFEDVRIMMPDLRIWLGDQQIHPSLTELRLMLILLSDPYEAFTSGELIRRLQLPSRQALAVTVWKLRQRIEQRYIISVHGCGYAFAERRN